MSRINADEQAQEVIQLIIKGTRLTLRGVRKALKNYISEKKQKDLQKYDEEGRIPLPTLGLLDGKTSSVEQELTKEELKLLEKEFKEMGVKRWSASKIGDHYIISFPDCKANEVELAFKSYLEKVKNPEKYENKFSRKPMDIYEKMAKKYNDSREQKARSKHQEQSR